ncbi:GNAT family N-acetyltransferase [Bacillus sp. Marseille-Q3570]|uniref:GNAT family N-acetyltransferase n=1 Tax=Bacillus sp. Marseille-Q3570 TaxID=2963522 RepID=UPI0021B7FD75|nr:GNAT family N-acetyltransferase [Bacillus sp. Marseille-Q3570]
MAVKKNEKAVLRTACVEDAAVVLEIQQEVIGEGDYFINVPEDFEKTREQQWEWIERISENPRDIMIVAEIDGKVVGWIVFISQERKRMAHTGSFGVMVQKEYRGSGIGKQLLEEMLAWAKENPLIEKVSLGVFSTNHRAIAIYESLGFVEEGRKVKEFKFGDNEYVDDVLMYKMV